MVFSRVAIAARSAAAVAYRAFPLVIGAQLLQHTVQQRQRPLLLEGLFRRAPRIGNENEGRG